MDLQKGLHPIKQGGANPTDASAEKIWVDTAKARDHRCRFRHRSRKPWLSFICASELARALNLFGFAARPPASAQERQHDEQEQADEGDDDADLDSEEQERDEFDQLAHERD